MKTYLCTYCLALLISLGLTPLVIMWARRRGLVDKPNVRKIHAKPVARVGGLAIFVGTILATSLVLCLPTGTGQMFRNYSREIVVLLGASVAIFAVGLYDDLRNARVRTKLLVEILATLVVITAGVNIDSLHLKGLPPIHLGWLGYLMTFCWIIGVTNAVNLIDGLDGLAAGISGLVCGVIAVLAMLQGNIILALIMLSLLGSLTGFLCFNFHPARIFMGDCGSLFLGFVIATASVLTAARSEALVGIGLPILALGIPIFDTLLSMLRRFIDRRGIMSPDRGHFHHRLIELGLKQRHVAVIAYAVTAGVTGLGFFMMATKAMASVTVLALCLLLLLAFFVLIGSLHLGDTLQGLNRRFELAQKQNSYQRIFEEAQLRFQSSETFDQWWNCVCTTAQAFDFTCVSLEGSAGDSQSPILTWQRDMHLVTDSNGKDLLQARVPIKVGPAAVPLHMAIQIRMNDSVESAGRRMALFTRLTSEVDVRSLADTQGSGNADRDDQWAWPAPGASPSQALHRKSIFNNL